MNKEIQVGEYKVEIKPLSWYENEMIKSSMIDGAKMDGQKISGMGGEAMMKASIKSIELSIVKISVGEDIIPYTDTWLKKLSIEDGDTLKEAIDTIGKKK